jgi:rod shape-determining protein MreC
MSEYGRNLSGQDVQKRTRAGVLAMAVALALLFVEAVDQTILTPLRDGVVSWSAPVIERGARSLEPVRAFVSDILTSFTFADEIERLRAENARLKGDAIRLEEVEHGNRELARLLRLSPGPTFESVAARVIAVSPDLVSASITVGVGRDQHVGVGDTVVANDVLFGRVVWAGAETSTIIRLRDERSRVPVVVGSQQARAVLTGDGLSNPKLEFISPDGVVREGDGVLTSGVGGLIARGLVVGRVIREASGWRVDLPGGHDVPRVVAVVRGVQPGDDPSARVDVGQDYGPAPGRLERRRIANRARVGGAP